MKSHEIEQLREPGYQELLETFIGEESEYVKKLDVLTNKYGLFLKEKFPGNVLINTFFLNIQEIKENHEIMVRKIRQSKRSGVRNLGTIFDESFSGHTVNLLKIYKNYFEKLNRMLNAIQTKCDKSLEFFGHLLNKASKNNSSSHCSMLMIPSKRLLQTITDLDNLIFYSHGFSDLEISKLKKTRTALCHVLGSGLNHKATPQRPGTKAATKGQPIVKQQPVVKRQPVKRQLPNDKDDGGNVVKRVNGILKSANKKSLMKLTDFPRDMVRETSANHPHSNPKRRKLPKKV